MCRHGRSGGPSFPSWHLQPQRLAVVAAEIDLAEARGGEAARGAVALLVDFELDLARAERGRATPHQRLAGEAHAPPVRIDRLDEAEDSLRLACDIGVQALAGLDA